MPSIPEPTPASTSEPASSQNLPKLWPLMALAVVLAGVGLLLLLAGLPDASAAGGCGGG